MVLDTNILIYAAKPGGERLREWLEHPAALVSIVSRIEALGFPKIPLDEKVALEDAFAALPESGLTQAIALRAISLRQRIRIKLADAVIAATALENSLPLVTRKVQDFRDIPELKLINPFDPVT
jgi:toxin FitB